MTAGSASCTKQQQADNPAAPAALANVSGHKFRDVSCNKQKQLLQLLHHICWAMLTCHMKMAPCYA
jgi:hypothetical protein